jgi:hypothetical protein
MRLPSSLLTALSSSLLLVACGGEPPARTAEQSPAPQEAIERVGDVSMRASVMQTADLGPDIARQYGISRNDNTVMLLVAVRKGSDAAEIALPAQVTATATDLRGQRQTIVMRELRAGDLLDYVGTAKVTLPDNLRFDGRIVREGGASSTLQFTREFYPR